MKRGFPLSYDQFMTAMMHMPVLQKDSWLCGGAIRRIITDSVCGGDFDFFFRRGTERRKFKEALVEKGFYLVRSTPRCAEYRLEDLVVQVIETNFESLDDVFSRFDFTICQWAWDGTCFRYTLEALESTEDRELVFTGTSIDIVSTIRRIGKYGKQGFILSDHQSRAILKYVVENQEGIREVSSPVSL